MGYKFDSLGVYKTSCIKDWGLVNMDTYAFIQNVGIVVYA